MSQNCKNLKYWMAAFLHDCAYRNTLQVWAGGEFVQANLNKETCDNLLKEAMTSLGTHTLTRDTIYEGVNLGGWKSFEEDRQNG